MKGAALGSTLNSIFSVFRNSVPEAQALLLVHSDGSVVDQCAISSRKFSMDVLASEYLPLLQIARRAAEDMGAGRMAEHIVVTESSIVIATHLPSNYFSIVVTSNSAHLGRLRYEIRRMAGDLEKRLQRS